MFSFPALSEHVPQQQILRVYFSAVKEIQQTICKRSVLNEDDSHNGYKKLSSQRNSFSKNYF